MNAHTPFDANQDWTNPYCQNSSNDPMVDALLGNAYHVVRTVYCNLGNLKLIYDFLNQYGMVLGVQSEAELKALTTKAKYARIYGFSRAGDRQVTDYLYVEGDRTGIIPDDPKATGSWITVATSGSNGGSTSSGEGAYIPWVYANGSATGGETTINVPDGTVGVPFIIVNGDMQYVGRGFEFNADNLSVTLAQPLEEGDEVVFLLTGVPAVPDNPNVNDWVQINWLYNNGAAVGGEQVIAIPYTFQSIPAVYKNGLRLYKGLATESYTADPDNQRILLTEPLATNDRLIVQIGGEAQVLEASDHTLQEVARATNVKNSEVILSTDTTQFLNDKKVVYSVSEQKAYGLPVLPTNVYIASVSNGQLTYQPGNVTVNLQHLPDSANKLEDKLSSSTGSDMIGVGDNTLTEMFLSLDNMGVLVDTTFEHNRKYVIFNHQPSTVVEQSIGGGTFVYRNDVPRTQHNGGTIIDVTVPYTDTASFLSGIGSAGGNGCLIRMGIDDTYDISWFGALPHTTGVDAANSTQVCFDSANLAGKKVLIPFSIATSKPLVIKSQSDIRGAGRYKTFILKTTTTTSGLDPINKPGDAPGSESSAVMDVDAVIIIAPYNSGEYSTFLHLSDFSIENNVNPASGVKPIGTYGIYAPYINLSHFERLQVYKVDVAFYTKTSWMHTITQWRAYEVNHNIWVDQGGTSLAYTNVWVHRCYYGAYYFKGVGYSNFVQMSADGLGNSTAHGGFAYRFVDCENIRAHMSVEETDNTSLLAIENSSVDFQLQAKYGIRGGTSTESMVAIIGSKTTISNSDVVITDIGSMSEAFIGTSKVTVNNSDFFTKPEFYTDNTTRVIDISDSVSVSGKTASSRFKNTFGADVVMQGAWDSSGRLVFKSPDGLTIYGVLFANSANNLLWKASGYPASNTDGIVLNV